MAELMSELISEPMRGTETQWCEVLNGRVSGGLRELIR